MFSTLDVLPDVDLGPVREREHADALARPDLAVQQVPQLRTLSLRIPLTLVVANGEDALLGARLLLVPACAADGRVEVPGLQPVEERLGLQQSAAALRAYLERLRAVADRLLVRVHDQPRPDGRGHLVPELDHFAELVGGVDVQQRERESDPDRTPSAPAGEGPTSPCRSSTASPVVRTRPRPRA